MKLLERLTRSLGFREGIIALAAIMLSDDAPYFEPTSGQEGGPQAHCDWMLISDARGGGWLNHVRARLANNVTTRAPHKVNRGGHFTAWQPPALFAPERRAAFRTLGEAP